MHGCQLQGRHAIAAMRLKKHVFCHLSYLIHQFFIPVSPASQSQIDSQSTSNDVPGLRANVSTTSPQVVWNCANNSCNISNSRLMSVSKSGREMQRRLLSNWHGILGILLLRSFENTMDPIQKKVVYDKVGIPLIPPSRSQNCDPKVPAPRLSGVSNGSLPPSTNFFKAALRPGRRTLWRGVT